MDDVKAPIVIMDVIDHRNAYGIQTMVVLNRYPRCVFERDGKWLIGYDDCVYQFFKLDPVRHSDPSNWKAFGGQKFDIPMADGSVEHAHGQWWDYLHPDFAGLTYDYGLSTVEKLQKCYVFSGRFHIERAIVDEWRSNNEPSNNYHKYNQRSKDVGKHTIVSQWEAVK